MRTAGWHILSILFIGFSLACDDHVEIVDRRYNPDRAANTVAEISETSQAAAQTFRVTEDDCAFERIKIVLTQGPSVNSGIVRVDIRPTDTMQAPDIDPDSAVASLEIDTATLPPPLVDEFTTFNFDGQPGRGVRGDDTYSVVVEFIQRDGVSDGLPIATLLGRSGDPYERGDGYVGASNVAFVENGDDYFFKSYLLCDWDDFY